MRDHLLFYINGRKHTPRSDSAFQSLSDYLRYTACLTGTKIVCSEGDCGACTVFLGRPHNNTLRYQIVNSCIQFLYQLDCTHIITVEGLAHAGALTQVQEQMIANHGSQCGFCTPGFVVALTACCQPGNNRTPNHVKDALVGNLCRCTGYLPIIRSGCSASAPALEELYPSAQIASDLASHRHDEVLCAADSRTFYKPSTARQAAQFRSTHPASTLIAGGTDLGVRMNKGYISPQTLVSISDLPDLSSISVDGDHLSIGALATWSDLEQFAKDRLPEFHRILLLFGSPQIRNAGTIGGNIANASPIADSLPLLYVLDAQLELTGPSSTRTLPIDRFYKGYKILDLKDDELITRIHLSLPTPDQTLKLYKVSRRKHLDIATFTAAILMTLADSHIVEIRIAYGGVGPTILRLPKTESFLTGKRFAEHTLREAGPIAASEITPISDVRAGRDYRLLLAKNILAKLYFDCTQDRATELSAVL